VRLTSAELAREAATAGFQSDSLEKVIRLMELLVGIRSHPFLGTRVALKGGTALNLFVFDVPRLSVDIDLNYVGAADREAMLADRPKVEQAIQAVCGRLGIQTRRVPTEHAGGKWRLSYQSASEAPAALELDVNFMLRTPIWPTVPMDSKVVGAFAARNIPLLDLNELAAGKLAALLARSAARDLFDARHLLRDTRLDAAKLRLGFVLYGGMNRKDWRTVSIDDVQATEDDVDRRLLPLLRGDNAPSRRDLSRWTRALVSDCRDLLSVVLPLTVDEREFLSHLNGRGTIVPELLTDNGELRELVQNHPGLSWKALNVRRRLGVGEGLKQR
jgi:predicted nucleotidyltransferase component of viral defense system